jgi:hypothetical protein
MARKKAAAIPIGSPRHANACSQGKTVIVSIIQAPAVNFM